MTAMEAARTFLPFAMLGLVGAEYLLCRLARLDAHDPGETAASLFLHAGQRLATLATAGLVAVPLAWVAERRLFDIAMDSPGAWIGLFLGVELAYYVHHRAMHQVRWLWATHCVHHSATRMNLAAALRVGWFGPATGGVVFYLPLVLLGFPPLAVLGMLAGNLAYQFFLHAARAPGLGPLEWVLNTPRHHHVHHASNEACLDRNFGGVLILFDRLLGTYAAAPVGEPLRFGLHGAAGPARNPFAILLREWRGMAMDFGRRRGLRARLGVLVERP